MPQRAGGSATLGYRSEGDHEARSDRETRLAPIASALAFALGAAAIGAIAIGALAIGRLAIDRVVVKRARFGKLEVEELTVRKLHVVED
ncbi:MAG: hypothetical protein WB689_00285 [Xanthobacteraceae bacterium]